METHNLKTQSLPVNSVDEAQQSDESGKDVDFLVKEDSRRVENEDLGLDLSPVRANSCNWGNSWTKITDSSPLDSQWYVGVDNNGPSSSSDWAQWPSEIKPMGSIEPKWGFQRNEEIEPVASIVPFENQPFKLGAGLANLGNTCFLNAVLQSFMHTVPLLQLLASNDHASPCDSYMIGFCVICVIRELIDLSLASGGGFVSPWKLVNNLSYFSSSFHRFQQEDAHEFLQCLLDRLESCCNDSMRKDGAPSESDNIVKQAFGGRLVSKLRCCNCGHCSDTYEPLIDLSLEIKDVDSLPAALESFTKVEKIDDPEIKFSCEKCKAQVSIEKQLLLDKAPSVAAFHLKRFENDGSFVEKVDKHVSFPLELDLLPYTDNNQINNEEMKYDLYAVIVHIGFSSCSGHYYSYVRSAPDEWYKFDDSEVFRVHEDLVLEEEAYIMLYAKRGTPWFSDFVEMQKPFIDPTIFNTSPKSVLDNVDAISITSPCILNNHASDVSESDHAADEASTKPELDKIEDSESRDVEPTSTPGPTGAVNSLDYHTAEADKVSLASKHNVNNCTRDIGVTGRMETLTPKTPSRSPSPEIHRDDPPENSYAIPRGHVTLADQVSCKHQSQKDLEQDLERKEACSLIKKTIPGSRGQQLMAAMRGSQSEGSFLNKKRRKIEGSPSSRDDRSSAGRRRSSFGSGLHPVMASSFR
ncbi:ubiquitin carboxyl-terminal hydrolase 20-like [Lycium ferocissimum]|uniref:ubiquitin carboxyl-terminal hydrolase 20-like n=1 Tax=Lycium ferocissimum TaxID=112874 RepID=UPI0028157390|nr:ubiquitin carboxyl-terminal hydrolase 20-like [Lycium ferocissimum]